MNEENKTKEEEEKKELNEAMNFGDLAFGNGD